MKKNIVIAFMAVSLTAMLFGCGSKAETETNTKTTNKVETTEESKEINSESETEEPTTEETTTEEVTTEEITTEETTTEEPTTEETTEEVTTEEQNNYSYEFEGKYWVCYSEYGNYGYYFDGETVISAMEEYGKDNLSYSVEDYYICIEGEYFVYEMSDGKLGLSYAMGDGSDMQYYEEVEKAEFENLFN